MSDLISRQDAIDAVMSVPDGNWANKRYAEELEEVPSARPTAEWSLIVILDSATNGEVIRALFPNGNVIEGAEAIGYEQLLDDKCSYCSWFDACWWNSPYNAPTVEQI